MGNTQTLTTGKFVDGVRRPSRSAVAAHKAAHIAASPISATALKATNLAPHKPKPARTLMRSAVKRPDIVAPSKLKAQNRTDVLARTPNQTIVPKAASTTVDAKRLKRASQTVRHPQVSHYGTAGALNAIQRPVPIAAQSLHVTTNTTQKSSSDIERIQSSISQMTGQRQTVVPVASQQKQQPKQDIFTEALARASNHEQTYEPAVKAEKRQRRGALVVTSVLCLLLLTGAMAYLNAPALSLKVAAVKSGVSARLPGYQPQGFTFGNLSYGKGNVTVSYASAADANQRFDITQRSSSWDSQSLLSNFVQTASHAYQTYQQAGRTVYMYGDNTATWVDSGVWYTVNGNTALSRDQILNLAGSL